MCAVNSHDLHELAMGKGALASSTAYQSHLKSRLYPCCSG